MTNNMTDDELRYAISEKREPKPDLSMSQDSTNPISGGGCWEFQPFENNGIWTPIDWLSWENAGRLMSELPHCVLIHDTSQDKPWGFAPMAGMAVNGYDDPGRAVAEGWLEANKK